MTGTTGTGQLVRLILRRDRWLLLLWILILAVLPMSYSSAIAELYPTEAARQAYASGLARNPSIVSLLGPAFGASLGALTAQRSSMIMLVAGLISLLTVIRHTRTEEETGRRELLGSTVLGRHAGLTAALIATFAADVVLGGVITLGLVSQGLPAVGAVAFGLAVTTTGWVFAAVGGVVAQLTEGSGAARAIGLGTLGLALLLRMAGDATGSGGDLSWLSWLSPLGWGQRVQAFADERWWVFALLVSLVAVLIAAAYPLSARRDVAAGILPPRLGPPLAAPTLRSPLALAWRLHRGLLLGWTVGLVALGAVVGSSADAIEEAIRDSAQVGDIIVRLGGTSAFTDAYLAGTMGLVALVAAGYGIQAALRMRAEETALRSEPVLGASVGRLRWMASHLIFALLGPAVALVVAGLTSGLIYGQASGDIAGQVPRVLAAAAVQLPAVWVLAAVTVLLFGLLPRLVMVSWAVLGVCVLLGQVGAIMQLDQWALDVSPFTHIPRIPGGELTVTPLLWLTGIAVLLAGLGLLGFRRRDVPVV
ncbi:ABC transporter permease [Micromonospora sp. NPDC003197]